MESNHFAQILSIGNIKSENQFKKIEENFKIFEIKTEIKQYEEVINRSPGYSENWPVGFNSPLKKPKLRWKYFEHNFMYDTYSTNESLDGK